MTNEDLEHRLLQAIKALEDEVGAEPIAELEHRLKTLQSTHSLEEAA